MADKWIQGAIKRPGRTTRWCKRHGYKGVTKACLMDMKRTAKKRHDKSLLGAAVFAWRRKFGDLKKIGKK